MDQPLLYNVKEAAGLLGISRSKFYALVAEQRIATVSVGRCRRVEPHALEKYISTIRSAG
jgi:excisionase family DNA binding protein